MAHIALSFSNPPTLLPPAIVTLVSGLVPDDKASPTTQPRAMARDWKLDFISTAYLRPPLPAWHVAMFNGGS